MRQVEQCLVSSISLYVEREMIDGRCQLMKAPVAFSRPRALKWFMERSRGRHSTCKSCVLSLSAAFGCVWLLANFGFPRYYADLKKKSQSSNCIIVKISDWIKMQLTIFYYYKSVSINTSLKRNLIVREMLWLIVYLFMRLKLSVCLPVCTDGVLNVCIHYNILY